MAMPALQSNVLSFTRLTAPRLKKALVIALRARRPVFVWGSPGIGKSNVIGQTVEGLGRVVLDLRVSQWDAVDTRGIPHVVTLKNGVRTRWAIPDVFPTDPDSTVVIFLDELNSAPPSVQAALYQLILDRRLGDYVLPDGVDILAAGNLETDRAVTHRMSTALAARFVHLELTVDHRAWELWALENDVHLACIAYLRMKSEHLWQFDPKSLSKAQAGPRTWEFASDLLKEIEADDDASGMELPLICGTLGETVGAEFVAFLPIYRNVPDPDAVIMSPQTADIPDDPSVTYALACALGERSSPKNFDRVIQYAERLKSDRRAGPEFMTLIVLTAVAKHKEVQRTKAYIGWSARNKDVLI